MSTIRGAVRILAILSLMLGVGYGTAWAHARLVRSAPGAGEHLSTPPSELRLEFSEPVAPRTSRVELVAPDFRRLGLTLRADTSDSRVLHATVPPLSLTGTHRVEWRLVGPDGHAVTGQFTFIIDLVPAVRAVESVPSSEGRGERIDSTAVDSATQSGVRFLSLLSMVVVTGSISFAVLVMPGVTRPEYRRAIERRLRAFCTLAAWALLGLALVRLMSHGILLSGSLDELRVGDLTDLLAGSTWGRGWMLQVAATIALLAGLRSARPFRWQVTGSVALALAISASMLGHPAAVTDVPLIAMGLDAVHGLAAGGWAGGVLALSSALPLVFVLKPANRASAVRELLRTFSPLALSCAAALVVTGVGGAWLQLRDLNRLWVSPYGLILVRKVIAVGLIAILGAYHWRVAQPSIGTDTSIARLRASVAIDVLLVLAVLVLTAMLTGTAPPTG